MFKKRAQGLSINVIIIAVIGLIILVVVIAMFTGKLGIFSAGVESAVSCENICKALGFDKSSGEFTKRQCGGFNPKNRIVPGKYTEVTKEDRVCCCFFE